MFDGSRNGDGYDFQAPDEQCDKNTNIRTRKFMFLNQSQPRDSFSLRQNQAE